MYGHGDYIKECDDVGICDHYDIKAYDEDMSVFHTHIV